MQWGYIKVTSHNQNGTISFSISFSSQILAITSSGGREQGNGNGELHLCSVKTNQFTYHMTSASSYFADFSYWLAVGV